MSKLRKERLVYTPDTRLLKESQPGLLLEILATSCNISLPGSHSTLFVGLIPDWDQRAGHIIRHYSFADSGLFDELHVAAID